MVTPNLFSQFQFLIACSIATVTLALISDIASYATAIAIETGAGEGLGAG